ncbi:thioredoxin family protein [Paraflavisolibacter sp. H34]|uniref:thioredoxin family protein n=1 Tax=Huijunlia imazamoxiresistens TaxID=3127457 RepID=UPI0030176DF5
MKLLALLLYPAFSLLSTTPWLTDFNLAKTEAAKSHKAILINFSGSDWCGPCIRMHEEIFESGAFEQEASADLVLVNADFPRLKKHQLPKEQVKCNEALADQYNPKGIFPLTVLVDQNGKVLKQWEGYPEETPRQFADEINTLLHSGH